jgi:hypothetical protein
LSQVISLLQKVLSKRIPENPNSGLIGYVEFIRKDIRGKAKNQYL